MCIRPNRVFIIAEVGINHNGDIIIAKRLIDAAKEAGCDAIKFQKRTIDIVYTKEELEKPRESPFGKTNGDLKRALEFNKEQYDEIDRYCKEINIDWFASSWDIESQKFLKQYNLKYNKIASAMLTNIDLLHEIASEHKYTFISTGMSTLEEIDKAVEIFYQYDCPFELMHTNSSYPMKIEEANLRCIYTLKNRYNCDVGYSGHESIGYAICLAAVAMGVTSIERHITLDRSMFGTDQAASLEIAGLKRLVADIRTIEIAMGDGIKKVFDSEIKIKEKLRRK